MAGGLGGPFVVSWAVPGYEPLDVFDSEAQSAQRHKLNGPKHAGLCKLMDACG
jgi:hypothetical protein